MARNLFQVSDLQLGIQINVLLEKIENKVKIKQHLDNLIPNQLKLVGWLTKCHVKKCCEARVAHKKQYEYIKV